MYSFVYHPFRFKYNNDFMDNIEQQIDFAAEIEKQIRLPYAQNAQQAKRIDNDIEYRKAMLKFTKRLSEAFCRNINRMY